MLATETRQLEMTYPTARIRGMRMTRLPEQLLGWTVLDRNTADELGRNHVGWFVGNHPGLTKLVEQLSRLDSNPEGGTWIVVPVGRDQSNEIKQSWPFPGQVKDQDFKEIAVWQSRKVWFAIPEDLKQLLPFARKVEKGIAGLIILDPFCLIYKSRSGTDSWGRVHPNDRPQHIVNFRAALDVEGWQPPLLLLTEKLAKSVNTDVVAHALCLNTFRFIDGETFSCWDVPIDESPST